MLVVYLAAAGLGLPLVGYLLFAGEGGDTGEGGGDGPLALVSLLSVATLVAFFGLGGLALTAVGTGAVTTALLAVVVGVIAAGLQIGLVAGVRRTSGDSTIADAALAGRRGLVVVPIEAGRRGRIAVDVNGQQVYLTAQAEPSELSDGTLARGTSVLVVEVERGVAVVARLDRMLE